MQQARHRKMTQGLLDLKRPYWNLRRFRTGRRKDQTPYALLGLDLPDLSVREFLKLTPAELRGKRFAMRDTQSDSAAMGARGDHKCNAGSDLRNKFV
jgi:hypothetical protein